MHSSEGSRAERLNFKTIHTCAVSILYIPLRSAPDHFHLYIMPVCRMAKIMQIIVRVCVYVCLYICITIYYVNIYYNTYTYAYDKLQNL